MVHVVIFHQEIRLCKMKKGIHPENYRTVLFYDSNAKQGFLIRSCARTTNTMKWEDGKEYPVFMCDTSSASHPFYTGKVRQVANEGRASDFANRYGKFGIFKSK
jgi:ribosomal protein L31